MMSAGGMLVPPAMGNGNGRLRASPLAKNMAKDRTTMPFG